MEVPEEDIEVQEETILHKPQRKDQTHIEFIMDPAQ